MEAKIRIIIFFALIALIGFSLPCLAADFKDVQPGNSAYPAIQKLLEKGIISIGPGKKFNGKGLIDLYQLATTMENMLAATGKIKEIEARPLAGSYPDVLTTHYAYKAVQDLVKLGVFAISGQNKFQGNAKVNRYTFYSYFAIFLEKIENKTLPAAGGTDVYPDLQPENPAYAYVQKLLGAGLLDGAGFFDGERIVDRYELAEFSAKVMEHFAAEQTAAAAGTTAKAASPEAVVSQYTDIPEGNYAKAAVKELLDEGILAPGADRKFKGNTPVNQYLLIDFVSKIIEKIEVGEQGELETANASLAYKDVPVSNFAYRSVQKLIQLRVIPPGDETELLYGDRQINRYQMVYFTLSAVERVLSDVMKFKMASPAQVYDDVPEDHFVHPAVQKLIWLGALENGAGKKFKGDEYVDRYELAFFTVNFVKAVFLKLKEIETFAPAKPVEYGFKAFLETDLNAQAIVDGKGPGQNLVSASADQIVKLSLDRDLGKQVHAFASLTSLYNFGNRTVSSPYLDGAYILIKDAAYILQAGRSSFYQGYSPFGGGLFVDTAADMVLANFDRDLFTLNASVGKLNYIGDVSRDTNFGFAGINPKLPPLFGWLELALGGSLITNLPDPVTYLPLPTRLTQSYGGLKVNLFGLCQLTAEKAGQSYSNPDVFPLLGYTSTDDAVADQCALTFFANDYGCVLSLGYLKIGNSYYLGGLANPSSYFGAGQGTENILFKARFYFSPVENLGLDLADVWQSGARIKTVASGTYNTQVFDLAYWNWTWSEIFSQQAAVKDQASLATSLSVSF